MPKLRLWRATSYGVKRSSVGNVAPMVQKLFVLNFHEMTNENATCGSHRAKDTGDDVAQMALADLWAQSLTMPIFDGP